MKTNSIVSAIAAAVLCSLPIAAHAILMDRGGGLIYDDVGTVLQFEDPTFNL